MAINIQQSIYSELADFLVLLPSLEAIATYKVPMSVQQYIDNLLEKNNDGELTADERLELEKILAVTDVFDLAKAKARLKLSSL
jgi:hypothetical protein